MTAETLKPFINMQASKFQSEKHVKNLTFFIFSCFIVIFCIGLSCFMAWNVTRTAQLQDELHGLQKSFEEINKKFGLDMLDGLDDFEFAYSSRNKNNDVEDTDDDDDDDGDLIEGSGGFVFGDEDEYEDEEDINEVKERSKRYITTSQGVPIIDESYAEQKKNRNSQPKLKYDWDEKNDHPLNAPPTRISKYFEQRSPPISYVTPPPRAFAIIEQKENQYRGNEKDLSRTTKLHEPQVRKSRVMSTNEDKSKAFRQVIKKSEYAKMMNKNNILLEHIGPPETVVYRKKNMRPYYKSLNKVRRSTVSNVNPTGSARHRTIAIHYTGDTSKYVPVRHEKYHGNGLLRHQGGVYTDWASPIWVNDYQMNRFFQSDRGVVTVHEHGIYQIYAQIYYHDDHDTNGFVVEHNLIPFLQCTSMTHSTQRLVKSNTCYTSGVLYLKSGDTVRLSDLGNHRFSLFDPAKSFFGLVKLGDARLPQHPSMESGDGYRRRRDMVEV